LMVYRLLCVLERNKMKRFIILLILIFFVHTTLSGREEIIQSLERHILNVLSTENNSKFRTGNIKSAFRSNMLVLQYRDELDNALLFSFLQKISQRPERQKSSKTPSGHFTLHWDESGSHSVPLMDSDGNSIPDYIDSAAVIFDYVWDMEIDSLGFQAPLNMEGLPVATYDIYFSELKSKGWYGATWPDTDDIPGLPGLNFTSYIEVDRDYSSGLYTLGLDGLRVTAAHEFNHAIQLGYNFREQDLFFYEMTSTWMEDVVFPGINDYFQYLPILFEEVSDAPFDRFSDYDPFPYGNALYLHMLSRQLYTGICSMIWQVIKNYNALEALKRVLNTAGSSWLESLSSYGVWLYYTGNRSQADRYFPKSALYDQIAVKEEDEHEYTLLDQLKKEVGRDANRFVQVTNSIHPLLQLGVLGEDAKSQGFHLLQRSFASSLYSVNTKIDITITEPDTVLLLLTNAGRSLSTFSVMEQASSKRIEVFPNPYLVKKHHQQINFLNIPDDATIYIYTVTGTLVAKLSSVDRSSIVSWDVRNRRGEQVSTGVYLYQVEGGDTSETGKLVIVR
jgi:hypothetical protein